MGESIAKLSTLALDNGALQAKILKTGGAFHTKFMEPAKEALEAKLKELLPQMKPPKYNIYLNRTGKKVEAGTSPAIFGPLLAEQLVSPVLWHDSVDRMIASGIDEFYEVGPMKQLKAMMKRINQKMWNNTVNIDV